MVSWILYLEILCIFCATKGLDNKSDKSKQFLRNFRRKLEETFDDTTIENDDVSINIISILFQNAKEIFVNEIPKPVNISLSKTISESFLKRYKSDFKNLTTTIFHSSTSTISTYNMEKLNEKSPFLYFIDNKDVKSYVSTEMVNGSIEEVVLSPTTESLLNFEKPMQGDHMKNVIGRRSTHINNSHIMTEEKSGRSCIVCDNLSTEDCNDPRNKLIPSTVCRNENDVCYSMHTPFGIIERGCLNINHNITTYVCVCNLCNYISISEMPYVFASKYDWIENVLELSRGIRLRSSILKDISCLSCGVNMSEQEESMENSYCLEGDFSRLKFQHCEEDEICGIKALRSDGYIWRGCVKRPLYNYWWYLCDHDLCNYDKVASLFDTD